MFAVGAGTNTLYYSVEKKFFKKLFNFNNIYLVKHTDIH